MSLAKLYVVSTIGLLLKNGTMANFGDEVNSEQVNDLQGRLDEGFLKPKAEFEKERKGDEQDLEDAPKVREDLLGKYKAQFKSDAPDKATNAEIQKALDSKKTIA